MRVIACLAVSLVFLGEGVPSRSREPNPGGQIVKYEPIKGQFFQNDNILISASALLVVPKDEKTGYEYTWKSPTLMQKGNVSPRHGRKQKWIMV